VRFLATDLSGASFTGANAAGTFFREAILAGASFQNANLAGADLSGADLSGANFSGANLSGANLASAILDGANLSGANFTGATLFGATLLGGVINGALFTDANLVDADFTDATGSASFGGANLFGALGVPGAPGAEPEVGSLASDGRFSVGAQLANQVFNGIAVFGASATGINLSGSRLLNAYLETVNFSGANLRGALFAQVNAELPLGSALVDLPTSFNLNFANADLRDARLLASDLSGSIFTGANLAGVRLFETILIDSRFVGANLAGGVLVGADLTGVDFSGADLSGANLSGAILEGANLSGANLRNALLFEAVLTGANLNQTDFRGANLNAADLSGALNSGSANFAGADLTDTIGADGAPLAEAGIGNLGPASFTISGTPLPGEIVSVDRTVSDPDGNGDGIFEVIWEATADGVVWEEVGEGVSFPVPPELAGLSLRAQVSYIDGFGNEEFVTVSSFADEAITITLAVAPASVTEDGAGNLIYTFTRTGPTTSALTVNYTVGGTATLGSDYTGIAATPATKSVTFAAGSATATVTVDPTVDTTIESDETVELTLASGTGYTIDTTAAVVGTITNDDFPAITLAVAPASVTEDGAANLIYTFSRTGPTTSALTVKYTVGGTATLGSDYTGIAATPATKSVTFGVGSATATVTVDPTADTTIERNETVSLRLASGTGYTIGTTAAVVGTITNDDFPILIGSNSADTIIGTDGNDTIEGGDGADTLTGGLGADVFRFASGIGGSGIDRITDFTASQKDVIQLENSVFTALPTPGVLAGAAFIRGAAATTAAHRIGYNPASGDLWYDADGIGAGMSITFAQLNTGVVGMTAARFEVT